MTFSAEGWAMLGAVHLLRCVGRAAVKNGGRALASLVPFGPVLYDIAADAFAEYLRERGEAELREDLERLAQAPAAEVRRAAEEAVAEEAGTQPEEIQLALVSYLTQMPAAVRQSLRRPSDPHGGTVPAGLALRGPDDLLPFLPARLPRFKPGDQPLAADWELVELLGVGGFGEVWKARHLTRSRQKPVALKFCLDATAAHALRNEAALHDHLDRVRERSAAPGIVPLLETYLRADPPCLMYEYVEGGDLTALAQDALHQNKLTPGFATRLVARLAEIVGGAHRLSPPLIHRDLKPSNVLVRPGAGDFPELLLTDFGIGSLVADQALRENAGPKTTPTAVRGAYTPLYASPQQARGESADPRDDVHALGVLWYQLVTGDLRLLAIPPDWDDLVRARGLSEDLTRLLGSCLASRAEKRPADAAELARCLTAPPAPPAPPTATLRGPKRTYALRGLLGRGDVADVNLAESGESLYVVKVARDPLGDRHLDNERKALGAMLTKAADSTYRKYLPTLAESFTTPASRRVNVFVHDLDLYTLEQVHARHPALDGRHLAWIFKRMLTALGFAHAQGRVHGAVLPCHVLLQTEDHGLRLVGWGQSVAVGQVIPYVVDRYCLWYPTEVAKRTAATAATDLNLAAKCVVYLAGGDPVRGLIPGAVPAPMQGFLRACLLEGQRMRPNDCWQLLEEFDELLQKLYGSPKFYPLNMT